MTHVSRQRREFELVPQLAKHPHIDLCGIDTPIEQLHRLGEKLGINLYAKRDDILPLAMGGNKVRQLEYYLGPAQQAGADTVIITGAVQSNFVRLCAAAARKMGWHPVVQLEDRVANNSREYKHSGNVLIDHLLGAEIHTFPEGENEAAADANLDRIAEDLRAKGRHPHVIHLGIDHPPVGGLGYSLAAVEAHLQLQAMGVKPDYVIVPSGSGLTHSGFLVGARAVGWNVPIYGICVRRDAGQQKARIERRTKELDAMLDNAANIAPNDILVDDATLAPGYGAPSDEVMDALVLAARSEALLLDPVYSGRTFAGLISLVNRGVIEEGKSVLFMHTGGTPGIFAYENEIMTASAR